ncbi:hypothetical protein BC332_12415 [Capsicum chinense]|nr:hypothetical protein BC332_12415 [Capsicum chinense]
MASEEGDGIRKRAEELGEAVRCSTGNGSSSRVELDSFIALYAVTSSWIVHLWNRVAELDYLGFSFSFSTLYDLIEF